MDLKGKICVVTGAAKGIGLAVCEALLELEARVVMADVDVPGLQAAATRFEPGTVLPLHCDVSRAESVAGLGEKLAAEWGTPDVWVNNAGLARHKWITEYSEAEIDLMLSVNLKGTILGSQEALRRMIPAKHGHIINVISTASLRGIPSETVYCAAKWGVRGFTQGLQEEAAAHGIRVTALLPGGVDTAFWDDASNREAPVHKFLTPRQVADALVKLVQMDDWCVPRELVLRALADSDFSVQP
ncbi:MAG: SDR family oxidoreductase [Verrucomicrobium sp.]|nr:SDR family oxidoreductase [Verrucomicrobium sp.]